MLTAQAFINRGAFDFLERPDKNETTFKEKKRDPNTSRARIEKMLLKLKKSSVANFH